MQNDKSPGNKRLTKVYKTALNELRKIFLDFVSEAEKRTFKFISETVCRRVGGGGGRLEDFLWR